MRVTEETEPIEPGLYPGMTREAYDEVDALNQSTIKLAYEKSLYHARMKQLDHSAPSEALVHGNALHTLILEPELFSERYGPMPVNDKGAKHTVRTGAGASAWAAYEEDYPGRIPIKQTRIDELKHIREMVMLNPTARVLLENASYKETSFFWEHPDYGFMCKGQVDVLTEYQGWTWAIDLKSALDASVLGFRRAVGNYGYMVQHHWYIEGLNEIAEAERRFGFVAFEKDFPYAVMVHELDAELVFEGRHRCDRISRKWEKAQESGTFPGYPQGMNTLTGAKWMMTHEYDEEVEPDAE
jgi:hypothetical protein